ncbi:MAG TPA: PilZ domain-containing protein [Thermoanaerobaculia bacterium]|nr:PilZ domain-containing protein [Thermoanaerobaculia bacterium]
MTERTEERREFQRLTLPEPIEGRFGGRPVRVVDLGVLGARLEHPAPLDVVEGNLIFEWKGQPIEFESGVVRTMEKDGRHQSGVRFFKAIRASDHDLRLMLSGIVSHEIDLRRSLESAVSFDESEPTRMEAPFVTFRLDDNIWLRRPAFTPRQPENGFTIPMRSNDVELKRLCLSYSAGDEEARRLVRLFAELSISEELGVPPRG